MAARRDYTPPRSTPRGGGAVACATLLFIVAMAGMGIMVGAVAAAPDPPPMPGATALPVAARTPARASSLHALPASTPVRVDIAAIGVHAPIAAAGVDSAGDVAVPPLAKPYLTNWYRDGPSPGEAGNAVLLGHVDSKAVGAAVFYKIGSLTSGEHITVTRTDGTVAVFRVTGVALYPKSKFPSALVYGPSTVPGLRLVTCGGTFDRSKGTYLGNVIVTATMLSSHQATAAEGKVPLHEPAPASARPSTRP